MKTPNGGGDQTYSHKLRDTCAHTTASPGILVFSRTMELLHVNRRAMELTDQSEKGATAATRCVPSRPVLEVCAEVQQALNTYVEEGTWVPVEVRKIISSPERWMLVRGLGLLDRNAIDRSRIVIVLDEVGLGEKQKSQPSQVHVQPYPSQKTFTQILAAR